MTTTLSADYAPAEPPPTDAQRIATLERQVEELYRMFESLSVKPTTQNTKEK